MEQNIIYQGNSLISIEIHPEYSHPVVIKKPSKRHPSQRSLRPWRKNTRWPAPSTRSRVSARPWGNSRSRINRHWSWNISSTSSLKTKAGVVGCNGKFRIESLWFYRISVRIWALSSRQGNKSRRREEKHPKNQDYHQNTEILVYSRIYTVVLNPEKLKIWRSEEFGKLALLRWTSLNIS